jgi:hypothetical protein
MVSDFRFPRYILLGDYWFKSNIRYMLQLFGVSRVVTRFCVVQSRPYTSAYALQIVDSIVDLRAN